MMTLLLFIGSTELMLIAGIALLLFGGKKLPEMMRGMGQGVKEFKKGMHEVSEPIQDVIKDATDLDSDVVSVNDEDGADEQLAGKGMFEKSDEIVVNHTSVWDK